MRARKWHGEAGVTVIEFAILLPFFLTLIFGIIEFAQVMFFQAALQHAVTGAARCASEFSSSGALGASNTPTDCSTSANVVMIAQQQAYGLKFAAGVFTPTLNSGGYNCVAASYTFAFGIPLMSNFAIPLTANSCYPT